MKAYKRKTYKPVKRWTVSKISTRTYQRRIAALKQLVEQMQWCHPMYNGSPSCANCGNQQHIGCATGCAAAKVTGDRGGQ